MSRLAKQIVRWFDETRCGGKDFEYRFTGKDSMLFLQSFMILISSLENDARGVKKLRLNLFVIKAKP